MTARRTAGAAQRAPWALGVLLALASIGAAAAPREPAVPEATPPVPEVPGTPSIPEAPAPPSPPAGTTALTGSFEVRKGKVHEGNAYLVTPSVRIEGTLDGDLFAAAASADIPGRVEGDVGFVGRSFRLEGEVADAARIWAADVRIDGTVDGELIASGGKVFLGRKSVIHGDARLYASEVVIEGTVDGDLIAAGGVVRLSGRVAGDAAITCDVIDLDKGARVEGSLDYSSRKKLDLETLGTVVGGDVRFEEKSEVERATDAKERAENVRIGRSDGDSHGFGAKIFAFFASLVVGLLTLRTFRGAAPTVIGYVGSDPLKSLGVGFLTVLSGIAAVFAAILIITIPLVLIYWLLLLIAFYLGKIPVAVWLGRQGLGRVGRSAASDGWAFVAGLLALYLVFSIPVIGTWVWFFSSLLGLGAIVLGARDHRLARRAPPLPAIPMTAPETPPPATPATGPTPA